MVGECSEVAERAPLSQTVVMGGSENDSLRTLVQYALLLAVCCLYLFKLTNKRRKPLEGKTLSILEPTTGTT